MDRNVVRIDKDCFWHLKHILEDAEEKNAKEINLYEYVSSSQDKVTCTVVTEENGTLEYTHIPIASYDE